jgi:hypothetical protein
MLRRQLSNVALRSTAIAPSRPPIAESDSPAVINDHFMISFCRWYSGS